MGRSIVRPPQKKKRDRCSLAAASASSRDRDSSVREIDRFVRHRHSFVSRPQLLVFVFSSCSWPASPRQAARSSSAVVGSRPGRSFLTRRGIVGAGDEVMAAASEAIQLSKQINFFLPEIDSFFFYRRSLLARRPGALVSEQIDSFFFTRDRFFLGKDQCLMVIKEQKGRGYLYKDEVSWTHYGGIRGPN